MRRYRFAKSSDGRDFKVDCPNCGAKKRFKRFYDEKEIGLMSPEYGACDRENSCGYSHFPQGEEIEAPKNYKPKPTNYIDPKLVRKSVKHTHKDLLSEFLISKFNYQAKLVLRDYRVASTEKNGEWQPLFWFISDKNKVHSGKIMCYELVDGIPKRLKSEETWKSFDWIHTKFKEFNYKPMAFGSHLLNLYPHKKVAIVESEKTALIMACVSPQYIWLATSSMNCLQKEYLPDLTQRDVILYPDKGSKAYNYWFKKMKEFQDKNICKSIKINTAVENASGLEEGDDIADMILNNFEK